MQKFIAHTWSCQFERSNFLEKNPILWHQRQPQPKLLFSPYPLLLYLRPHQLKDTGRILHQWKRKCTGISKKKSSTNVVRNRNSARLFTPGKRKALAQFINDRGRLAMIPGFIGGPPHWSQNYGCLPGVG